MVPARMPDFIPSTVFAVTAAHVYVAEGRYGAEPSEVVHDELSQLAALALP